MCVCGTEKGSSQCDRQWVRRLERQEGLVRLFEVVLNATIDGS